MTKCTEQVKRGETVYGFLYKECGGEMEEISKIPLVDLNREAVTLYQCKECRKILLQ